MRRNIFSNSLYEWILFLDYHNILWYYHHVIVFCATPIQAFQNVSEPHTLLSLYFSQQHHYAAEQWAVDFFVFEGTFSPAARMTPAMPSAGASIREDQDVILAFFILFQGQSALRNTFYIGKVEHQMNEQVRPKAIARRITRPRKARPIPRNLQYRLYNVRTRPKRPYLRRERRG